MKDFECQRCGKCCLQLGGGLSATQSDAERWKEENRQDILAYIDYIECGICPKCNRGVTLDQLHCADCGIELERKVLAADLWFDPETREELTECPFLRRIADQNKYECSIHDTKPEWCRGFPIAVSTECEKCHLNFVKYFKDTVFPEMSLEEYLKWTLDDFFEKVLKNVECCPKCGNPIPKLQQWALDNCPAAKAIQRKQSARNSRTRETRNHSQK